jgi:plastocyanin
MFRSAHTYPLATIRLVVTVASATLVVFAALWILGAPAAAQAAASLHSEGIAGTHPERDAGHPLNSGTVSTCNENTLTNTVSGGGLVTFACSGVITLTAQIVITTNTTIDGSGQTIVLNGNNANRIFNVTAGTLTLLNLTLTNGSSGTNDGGAIYVSSGANLTISNTRIMNSSASASNEGGGIFFDGNTLFITNSQFINNQAVSGGAVRFGSAGTGRIVNTLFARNAANPNGSAIYVGSGGDVTILHATITSPTVASGSALYISSNGGNVANITNTIITSYTTGIERTGGAVSEEYNLFFGHTQPFNSGITHGGNSITGTPAFVDPNNDNYHLSDASLAVNRGANFDVTFDIDGDARPQQGGFDIGYDESPYSLIADVTISKNVTPSSIAPNQRLTYTIVFTNLGPQPATGVSVTDILPISLTNIVSTTSAGITRTVNGWLVANLAVNARGFITVAGIISNGLAPSSFTNLATITSAEDITTTNNSSSVDVTVFNRAPTANAGANQTTTVNSAVTLTGTASSDPDGHALTAYRWEQTGGASVTLNTPDNVTTTFTAPSSPGALTFTLTVTDAFGASSVADEKIITVTDITLSGLSATNSSTTTLGNLTTFTATLNAGSNPVYTWRFGDGATGAGNPTTHLYGATGIFTAVVTATNSINTITATTRVTITNRAPIANAGADQTTTVSSLVTLDGSASSDPDGHTPLTYLWTQSGGTAVTLNTPSNVTTTFTAPITPTTLTFTLRVTDSYGLGNVTDTVRITVTDVAISSLSATNSSTTTLGQITAFTATILAGTNVTYRWRFGDGTVSAASASPFITRVYTTTGIFTAIVTATNSINTVTSTTSVTITNLAPIADAGTDQSVNVASLVTLDGNGSADPDGHLPLTYRWTQSGGPTIALINANNVTATFTAPITPTILTFTLRVTDSRGLASTPAQVIVTSIELPLSGLSASNSSTTTLGQPTAFTATLSSGTLPSFEWNFGDGTVITSALYFVTHTYANVGAYTTLVTATNSLNSLTATTQVTITNLAPIANAGANQTVTVTSAVTLTGAASADPDGHTPLVYQWTQTGGTNVILSAPTNVTTTFTAPAAPTILTFTLAVTDARGLAGATAEVIITVRDVTIAGLQATNSSTTTLGQPTAFTVTLAAGSNVLYVWNFGDGNVTGASAALTTTHPYATTGFYTAIVTATNQTNSITATTRVTVTNRVPLATASPTQTVVVNSVVTLDGGSSADPDGHTPLSYLWTQTGGNTVTLANPFTATTTFTAPSTPSVLTFTLIVSDAYGLPSTPAPVVVTVQDVAPTGLSATNSSPTTLGQTTLFTATLGAGSNVTYTWNFGDGSGASGATPSHTYALSTTYIAIVTATNTTDMITATTRVTITNQSPIANAGADQSAAVSATVTLNGSGSADPDGHLPLAYLWRQTGGPAVTLSTPHTVTTMFTAPASPTILTFTLIVTDARGLASSADSSVVIVTDSPILGLQATNSSTTTLGFATAFSATITSGTNVAYEWNFGDGATASGAFANHTYAAVGNYLVVVTGTNNGNLVTATTPVAIIDVAITGLTVTATQFITTGNPSYFTATISSGTGVVYDWNFGDGATLTAGPIVSHTYSSGGFFIVSVTARNTANSETATVGTAVGVVIFIQNFVFEPAVVNIVQGTVVVWTNKQERLIHTATSNNGSWNSGRLALDQSFSFQFDTAGSYAYSCEIHPFMSGVINVGTPILGLNAVSNSPTTVGQTIAFTASTTSGTVDAYQWNFGDGSPTSGGVTTTHAYAHAGTYTVIVTATNIFAAVSKAITVTVLDIPISGLSVTIPSPLNTNTPALFAAVVSAGTGIVYTWNFGDGTLITNGSTLTHTYTTSGAYTLIVTATNTLGYTATTSIVNVSSQRNVYLPLMVR